MNTDVDGWMNGLTDRQTTGRQTKLQGRKEIFVCWAQGKIEVSFLQPNLQSFFLPSASLYDGPKYPSFLQPTRLKFVRNTR